MKYILPLILPLVLGASLRAAEAAAANTLTEKEIAEGWIQLYDGKTLFGWRSPNDSHWKCLGSLAPRADGLGLLVTTTAFTDFDISLEYQTRKNGTGVLLFGCDHNAARPDSASIVRLDHHGNGWHQVCARVHGHSLLEQSICCDKVRKSERHLPPRGARPQPAYIGLMGNYFIVRNVRLRPLNLQSLSGKDLGDWRESSDKQTFAASGEGHLAANAGPAQLVSKGQWSDFVLQSECLCKGPQADGGVLLRADPARPLQGYLVRIHNRFTPDPSQEYNLAAFDPNTHERRGQVSLKSSAVDFGTGGIDRLMPARCAAAEDKKWLTLTVVAQGRHFATWVNGVQQVDWTDDRPANANAQSGCRLEKGCLGLLVRDREAGVLFRNIRIDAMPAPRTE